MKFKNKYCFLDFEFTDSEEFDVNLICCSYLLSTGESDNVWLQDEPKNFKELRKKFLSLSEQGYTFVAYQVVAEARCFLTLGIEVVNTIKWIDLHIEDKMLVNSHERFGYGSQLVKGKEIYTVNDTKWGKTEEELKYLNMSKPEKSLSAACFRYLGLKIDTERKNAVRDLIITKKRGFDELEKSEIIKYCESDVEHLPHMLFAMGAFWTEQLSPNSYSNAIRTVATRFFDHAVSRGKYAALTAVMEQVGYPVNRDKFFRFINATPKIISACMKDIAAQFDEEPEFVPFSRKWKTKNPDIYKMNTVLIRNWIAKKSGKVDEWLRTDKGHLSLSKDAWSKHYDFKHDYPEGNYPAQIIRYLKLKESLNGFLPGSKKKIEDSYSHKDSRVRPYMNCFGAQSARSQPSASTFIPLKAAWTRCLIEPTTDKTFICGIDYASQEVLIQAILAKDEALYDSYVSGDVYLDFAKKAGAVPKDGTKKEYKRERNVFKSTFLGISYGMGNKALAAKLVGDTGDESYDDEKAEDLISTYFMIYHQYGDYLQRVEDTYYVNRFLSLKDDWVLFGDNLNKRSFKNFMVQGTGSVIMRVAVKLCYDRGIKVIFTLHDALYAELSSEEEIETFNQCMLEAVHIVFKDDPWAQAMRTDINCFGSYFETNGLDCLQDKKIKCQTVYIDERAERDYAFFRPFFDNPDTKE